MSRRMTAAIVAAATIGLGVAWAQPGLGQAQQAPGVCGWIGVLVSPITAAFADSLGMTEIYGAIFDRPEPGSPAASAHIEAGDVITSINGAKLVRAGDFATTIAQTAPGTTVYLTTWRDQQLIERKVVVGSAQCRGSRM
jgi:S1-C subfamily serine protease